MNVSGSMYVTTVVVMTTRRNTAIMTVFRMRRIRQ
jgi:hypothetical protein